MTVIFAKHVFHQDGWIANARLEISQGLVHSIKADQSDVGANVSVDVILPGVPNAHSHAFQRALAGHCEFRDPAQKDNFWTWRQQMYALASRVDASTLRVIARQLYIEMLEFGYTTVAEFHYLHRAADISSYPGNLRDVIFAAANDAGIRFTYIPILYERAGFCDEQLSREQQQFVLPISEFVDDYHQACELATERQQVGVGAHSLRAVSKSSLDQIVELSTRNSCPMHIHIAEQIREVEQCVEAYGLEPVPWLLQEYSQIGHNWCLVHATHAQSNDLNALAKTGAIVCICPSTEANLGDGLFYLDDWLYHDGNIAIGSDSQVCLNPFEELRLLEYGQRLILESRNIARGKQLHTGVNLFSHALYGGGLACGLDANPLAEGNPADLITFELDNPTLAGHDTNSFLDALIFSGASPCVDRVMVSGDWVVVGGKHRDHEPAATEYIDVVSSLWDG